MKNSVIANRQIKALYLWEFSDLEGTLGHKYERERKITRKKKYLQNIALDYSLKLYAAWTYVILCGEHKLNLEEWYKEQKGNKTKRKKKERIFAKWRKIAYDNYKQRSTMVLSS